MTKELPQESYSCLINGLPIAPFETPLHDALKAEINFAYGLQKELREGGYPITSEYALAKELVSMANRTATILLWAYPCRQLNTCMFKCPAAHGVDKSKQPASLLKGELR